MIVKYVSDLRRDVRVGRLRVIREEDRCNILHHLYEDLAMINQNTCMDATGNYGILLNLRAEDAA